MLVSQREEYLLQQKLDSITVQEAKEIKRMSHSGVMNPYSELYDYFAQERQKIRVKYNKQRNKAIWWYQHKWDVVAAIVITTIAVAGVFFLLA